jgi:hypothetical protein
MDKKELIELIDSYRKKSQNELRFGEKKCRFYDRLAGQIEESFDEYLDDFYETEEDIINSINEQFADADGDYDFDEED